MSVSEVGTPGASSEELDLPTNESEYIEQLTYNGDELAANNAEDEEEIFENESDQKDDGTHSPAPSPASKSEDLPTIATFKTRVAPSVSRLDSLLNAVQSNSLPVLPDSSEYLDYPRPKESLETDSTPSLGEQLTYASSLLSEIFNFPLFETDSFFDLLVASTLSPSSYWKRVDSFTSFGWFGKPVTVSPLECARFGWELHSTDTLRCAHCKKQLIHQNSDPSQLVSYTTKFVSLLQSAHDEECPFKSKAVSKDIYALQTRPSSVVVSGFYERLYLLQKSFLKTVGASNEALNIDIDGVLNFGVRKTSTDHLRFERFQYR